MPTVYEEPKGLFILEALANGVPVVQPSHGAFPELIEATGGGLLVRPGSAEAVAAAIDELMIDAELRERLARRGKDAVHRRFGDEVMAAATLDLYREFLSQCPAAEAGVTEFGAPRRINGGMSLWRDTGVPPQRQVDIGSASSS